MPLIDLFCGYLNEENVSPLFFKPLFLCLIVCLLALAFICFVFLICLFLSFIVSVLFLFIFFAADLDVINVIHRFSPKEH